MQFRNIMGHKADVVAVNAPVINDKQKIINRLQAIRERLVVG